VSTDAGDRERGAPVSGEPSGAPREEMHAAPPFLTWGAIYAIVIGALAAEVAICAALTR
jgi:hypothetical protein